MGKRLLGTIASLLILSVTVYLLYLGAIEQTDISKALASLFVVGISGSLVYGYRDWIERAFGMKKAVLGTSHELVNHRKMLLKAYTKGIKNAESPWTLKRSSYGDRMLEHLKTGYPELGIAVDYEKWDSLQKSFDESVGQIKKFISSNFDAIRNTQFSSFKRDGSVRTPPRNVNEVLIKNRVFERVISDKGVLFVTNPTGAPNYVNIVEQGDVVATLHNDNQPEGFANGLNNIYDNVKGDVDKMDKIKSELTVTEGKFMDGFKRALASARISQLKGKCSDCPP